MTASADVDKSAVQLASCLPEETLCKLLASREVSEKRPKISTRALIEPPLRPAGATLCEMCGGELYT